MRQVTNDLNNYGRVSLTSDSNSLVTVQLERSSNIWVAPVNIGSTPASKEHAALSVDVSHARQITSGSSKLDGLNGLAWTPDGRLTYASEASGNWDIWIMNADGSGQKQLTSDTEGSVYQTDVYQAVSPDGRYLLFTSDRVTSNPHIWRMNIDGANAKQLTNGTGEGNPLVTPDSRSVIYMDFSSKRVIWKVSIDGGDATQLTDKPSSRPAISPDGKFIACGYQVEPNAATKLAVIPIEGGAPVKLFDLPLTAELRHATWTSDGRALVYIDTQGSVSNLWMQPLDGGQPQQLTDFKSDLIYWFDFSRDGRQLALARGNQSADVVLFSNVK